MASLYPWHWIPWTHAQSQNLWTGPCYSPEQLWFLWRCSLSTTTILWKSSSWGGQSISLPGTPSSPQSHSDCHPSSLGDLQEGCLGYEIDCSDSCLPTPTRLTQAPTSNHNITTITVPKTTNILSPTANAGDKTLRGTKLDRTVGLNTKQHITSCSNIHTTLSTCSTTSSKPVSILQYFTSIKKPVTTTLSIDTKTLPPLPTLLSTKNSTPQTSFFPCPNLNVAEQSLRNSPEPESGPYVYRDLSLNVPIHLRISSTLKDYYTPTITSNRFSALSEETPEFNSDTIPECQGLSDETLNELPISKQTKTCKTVDNSHQKATSSNS